LFFFRSPPRWSRRRRPCQRSPRRNARGRLLDDGAKGTAGVAAGYDFDLGPAAFSGLEVSGDKILLRAPRLRGASPAAWAPSSPARSFTALAVTPPNRAACAKDRGISVLAMSAASWGTSGKVEYRHYFGRNGFNDANAVVAGVGVKF
jgi:hypothetical protein